MFPLNGMRSQLKERLCLFLIRKQQLIFRKVDVPFKWHAIAVEGEVMSVSHS